MNRLSGKQLYTKPSYPIVTVDVDPIKVIWMCYTKQFRNLLAEFNYSVKFFYTTNSKIEVSGIQCEDAAKKLRKLVEDTYIVEFLDHRGIFDENQRKLYRPFIEVTMTEEFADMQKLDRGMCLLTKFKYIEIAKKMARTYNYYAAQDGIPNLPEICVMLFCKQDYRTQFAKIITENTNLIAKALQNNVTPMQAPKFNPKGLILKRTKFYSLKKTFQIEKIDMIWLSQFDKLQKISQDHLVYIDINDAPENDQQLNVTINVQKIAKNKKNLYSAYNTIMDRYLKAYMLLKIDVPFPQKQNFNGIVTKEMRNHVLDYLRQKFPRISRNEIEAFRFIDSNVMEDTGMDLDNFYQTTIVQALDELQSRKKYLYVLGLNEIANDVNFAAEKYLKETQQWQQDEFPHPEVEETYLNNQFDESQILDNESEILYNDSSDENDLLSLKMNDQNRKIFQIVNETSLIKIICYNNSTTKFFERERFNQIFFDDYSQNQKCPLEKNSVEIINKQLILTFNHSNEQNLDEKIKSLIAFINQYFNNEFILRIAESFYVYLKQNQDFLEQKAKENMCNFDLYTPISCNEFLNFSETGCEDSTYKEFYQKIKSSNRRNDKENINCHFLRVFNIQASYKQNCIIQLKNKEKIIIEQFGIKCTNGLRINCKNIFIQLTTLASLDFDGSTISINKQSPVKKQSQITISQNSQISIDLSPAKKEDNYPELMHFEDLDKVKEIMQYIQKSSGIKLQFTTDYLILSGKTLEKEIFKRQLLDMLKKKSYNPLQSNNQSQENSIILSSDQIDKLVTLNESQHFYILTESQIQYLEGDANDIKKIGIQIIDIDALTRFDIENSFLVLFKLSDDGRQQLEKQLIGKIFKKLREGSIQRAVLHIKQTFPLQVVDQFSPYDYIMLKSFEKWNQQINKYIRIYNQKEFKCYFLETNRRRLVDNQQIEEASLFKNSIEFRNFIEKEHQFAIKISNETQLEMEEILIAINKVKSLQNLDYCILYQYWIFVDQFTPVPQLKPEKGHYLIGVCYQNGPKSTLLQYLGDIYMMQYAIIFN